MPYAFFLLLLLAAPLAAQKKDLPGSADLPLVGRYEGALIVHFETKNFDESQFLTASPDKPSNTISLEGKWTTIGYDAPAGRSSLEVFRNYQQKLESQGFKILYSCEKDACGSASRLVNAAFKGNPIVNRLSSGLGAYKSPRYATFRRQKEGVDIALAMYIGEDGNLSLGPRIFLHAVESKAMESGKILVPTAQEMVQAFATEGRIALYGIFFDTGSATVKPESTPTLEQIAALLKSNAKLSLLVVGHTDNVGDFQSNLALSQRRATAVVEALVKQHAIPAARLQPFGAGMIAPAASNAEESGRAKNRRVELVPR